MAGTVTGENAAIFLQAHAAGSAPTMSASKLHSFWGMGSFSLTLDRGTVEQDLIGLPGNYFAQGALSMDGSFTLSRFGSSGSSDVLNNIIEGTSTNELIAISGSVGSTSPIHWFLVSCQITGYDVSMGDADTISEASIDFALLDPQNVTYKAGLISDA